jgi:hypothetical protein
VRPKKTWDRHQNGPPAFDDPPARPGTGRFLRLGPASCGVFPFPADTTCDEAPPSAREVHTNVRPQQASSHPFGGDLAGLIWQGYTARMAAAIIVSLVACTRTK